MALDLHIHDVDYIRYLMGREPDRVTAWAVQDSNGIPQHILSNYCFGDSNITAEASWDYPTCLPFENTFRVRLEKAAVEHGIQNKVSTLFTKIDMKSLSK